MQTKKLIEIDEKTWLKFKAYCIERKLSVSTEIQKLIQKLLRIS